jgi:hypothetical protein
MNKKFYTVRFGNLYEDKYEPPKINAKHDLIKKLYEYTERIDLPILEFIANKKTLFHDLLFNLPGIFLVSPKLRTLIEKLEIPNIDFHPVRFITKQGDLVRDDYFYAHIRNIIEALDWDNSICDTTYKEYGVAGNIELLRLNLNDLVLNSNFFRLKELVSEIIASEEFSLAIKNENITGLRLEAI